MGTYQTYPSTFISLHLKVQPNLRKEFKLKMVTQRITLLFAICSFANSLPSSSSKSNSKGSSSNSLSVNKTSKGFSSSSTCCSSTSPITYEAVGQSSDGRSMYK